MPALDPNPSTEATRKWTTTLPTSQSTIAGNTRTAPPQSPSRIDAALGDTSGTQDGNVRAILSVIGMVGAHALVTLLVIEYALGNIAGLKDIVTASVPTLITADVGLSGFYFGHRAGEQAGGG